MVYHIDIRLYYHKGRLIMKHKLISLRLPYNIERQARIEAAKQDISRSELVRQVVVKYLDELSIKNKSAIISMSHK